MAYHQVLDGTTARLPLSRGNERYGKDTNKLLRKLRASESYLNVEGLQIHSLPPLSENLLCLICLRTQITRLPELPTRFTSLHCAGCPIKSLPELPPNLKILMIENTQITVLPRLPKTLILLNCENTPLLLKKGEDETMYSYRARWDAWWDEQDRLVEEAASMERCQERCLAYKEDLMMEMWHPRRIQKLIEADRWDLFD